MRKSLQPLHNCKLPLNAASYLHSALHLISRSVSGHIVAMECKLCCTSNAVLGRPYSAASTGIGSKIFANVGNIVRRTVKDFHTDDDDDDDDDDDADESDEAAILVHILDHIIAFLLLHMSAATQRVCYTKVVRLPV